MLNKNPYDLWGRRARLLLVDQHGANLMLLQTIFGAEHELYAARSGSEALALCASMQPDLILLDVQVPDGGGLDVCRRLKEDAATSAVPVIFFTGADGADDEVACWDAGGVDFVSKPFNAVTLRNRVHTHLALKFQADMFRDLAYLDGLTGVANRRYFDQRLTHACLGAQRDGSALALVMIDVDHFKLYNDHYGHLAGDACLRQVCAALRSELMRPHDLLARYGGEEFVCLLPDTSLDGAAAVAGALCQAVRAVAIEHRGNAPSPVVTISAGVAVARPEELLAPTLLVGRADCALYAAKQTGRDRVCHAH